MKNLTLHSCRNLASLAKKNSNVIVGILLHASLFSTHDTHLCQQSRVVCRERDTRVTDLQPGQQASDNQTVSANQTLPATQRIRDAVMLLRQY